MKKIVALSPAGVQKVRSMKGITESDIQRFYGFLKEVYKLDFNVDHTYTDNAQHGLLHTQVADLLVQFSVFSNYFLIIQCKHMVFAVGNDAVERMARNILVNELGVKMDPTTGETDGKTFKHEAAHINWLRKTASVLNLKPPHIPYPLGHWKLGTTETHEFLTRLEHAYGSMDTDFAAGASFAVEAWAGYGIGQGEEMESKNFWRRLLKGLEIFNLRSTYDGHEPIKLGFFQYHFDTELGHAVNVENEVIQNFFDPQFNTSEWLAGAREGLAATNVFWKGLENTRQKLA